MRKPNLFIVGAAKSGTTSLYHYLNQHPDIFMCPIKEPNYFCKDIKRESFTQKDRFYNKFDINKYLANSPLEKIHIAKIEDYYHYDQLFREVANEKYFGEASSSYLYSTEAAKEILNFNPKSKIIIILRNPAERAFSHWKMNISGGFERQNVPFKEAFQNDLKNPDKGYYQSHLYIELGLYYEQIKRFMNLFPMNSILILFYEDLLKNSKDITIKLFSFLDVEPISIDFNKVFNASKIKKFPALNRLANKYHFLKILPNSAKDVLRAIGESKNNINMPNNIRIQISDYFKSDIKRLEVLIGQNLSAWYN